MIIMAIIALAVLFIIIAIFTNVTEKTAENVGSCVVKGGYPCDSLRGGNCNVKGYPIKILVSDEKCKNNLYVCCLPAPDK